PQTGGRASVFTSCPIFGVSARCMVIIGCPYWRTCFDTGGHDSALEGSGCRSRSRRHSKPAGYAPNGAAAVVFRYGSLSLRTLSIREYGSSLPLDLTLTRCVAVGGPVRAS